MQRFPTTLWLVGAAVAVAALTPVVGNVASVRIPAETPALPNPPTGLQKSPSDKASGIDERATSSPSRPSAVTVQSRDTRLGPTAVNGSGQTLYLSTLDSNSPSNSVCLSQKCLAAWKPVILPSGESVPVAGDGIDPGRLGSFKRSDGVWQVTLGGWPLYIFVKDVQPGDVKGEGLKGTWHAVSPDGKRADVS
ncbi:hypothetical protein [Streptomyces sp. 3211]|uniref:COG4315 family predicted lipoprotein n=1 Tax=Streptomyces sp. 3211 TaxID=1964449 RepID=UPI001C87151F